MTWKAAALILGAASALTATIAVRHLREQPLCSLSAIFVISSCHGLGLGSWQSRQWPGLEALRAEVFVNWTSLKGGIVRGPQGSPRRLTAVRQ